MANTHIPALEEALFRNEVLKDEDITNYTGLERIRLDPVKETIDCFKPLTYWTGKAVTSIRLRLHYTSVLIAQV